jgi:hypothetical protein
MNTVAFDSLPVGSLFKLEHITDIGSHTLKKINPVQYQNKNGLVEGLFYTAEWIDGPSSGTKAVIPTGTTKSPYMIVIE